MKKERPRVYNVQVSVADKYIAVVDVNQYRSDMDCFIPLMNKFYTTYGFYPKYPAAEHVRNPFI